MAAKPALLLSPDGSFDANGRVEPTISGGVLTVSGQYGNAWQINEATTNRLINPSYETDTTGWLLSAGATRVTTDAAIGTACVQLTGTASVSNNAFKTTVTPGQSLTVSFAAKLISGTTSLVLYISQWTAANALVNTTQVFPLTAEGWNRYERTIVIPPDRVNVSITLQITGTNPVALVDAFQIEDKAYATPYADGSLGAGHAWTGTPHASTSTRAAGRVYYDFPDLPVDTGSVLIRWNAEKVAQQYGQYIGGLGVIGGVTERVLVANIGEDGSQQVRTRPSTHNHGLLQPTSKTFRTVYMEYTPTTTASDFLEGGGRIERGRDFNDFWSDNRVSAGGSGNAGLPIPLNGTIEGVLVFDDVLTDAEVAEYTSMEAWGWSNMFSPYANPAFPSYSSGVFSIEPTVFKTDRFNRSREDISQFINRISVDGDIDRSGSKLACNIEAFAEVLEDGDWVAPYLTVVPEIGEITNTQMGHYRIDPPSVVYSGNGEAMMTATGVDSLDMLANVKLTSTIFTPQGADAMQDVNVLISMATRGHVGPNLVQNPSFEAQDTVGVPNLWSAPVWTQGGAGVFVDSVGGYAIPTGSKAWGPVFNSSMPAGATAVLKQSIPIADGMVRKNVWITGMWLPAHEDHRGYIMVDFYDSGMNMIDGASIVTRIGSRPKLRWIRENAYGVIPENANSCIFRVVVTDAVGGYPSMRRSSWDDVAMHTISGEPVPEEMIALPDISLSTSSRIQTAPPSTYLEAIDERLVSAGSHPLYPLLDSRITSKGIGNIESATVARQYTEFDARIVSTFQVERSAVDRFNTIYAVSEDTSTGQSLYAVAINDDPGDKFSTVQYGAVSDVISVQGSTINELQKLADERLAQASTQEELVISVLPDPLIGFHDIIEVVSQTRAAGRWSIVSVTWGMDSSDSLVTIRARRLLRRKA